MADTAAIAAVAAKLKESALLTAIFGPLSGSSLPERKAELRRQFGFLASVVHPDHAAPPDRPFAAAVMAELLSLRRRAEVALGDGSYETAAAAEAPTWQLVAPSGSYTMAADVYREGDFSVLYRGRHVGTSEEVLVKVATDPTQNSWLEQEALLLAKTAQAGATDPLRRLVPFMPAPLDSLWVAGEGGRRYRATVLRYRAGYVSLADIMATFPDGLPPEDTAWIARRVFAQAIAARMLGVVHGAIVPDHVLVHPESHEPLHVGWAHARQDGRITHVIDRWRHLYPPEILKKERADERSDRFMAAATVTVLLGGDVRKRTLPPAVPRDVAALILRCLDPLPTRRPEDGVAHLSAFTQAVRKVWGREYRPLRLPVRS